MAFECKHCGQCCIDECTQINLSVADIIRICRFLNCNIGGIMHRIGIKPFADTDNTNKYDYELGLNIPCEFREGEKCAIYEARPLNCRMFPFVFIANDAQDAVDPSHKCISDGISLTDEEKQKYREYARFIGNLILKEAEQTDEFYAKNNLHQSKILPAYVFPSEDPDDPMHAKEITKSKIKMAMSIMDPSPYKELKNQLQNFILRIEKGIIPLSEINKKEQEFLG
jgi:Fe-S-cluster containining protein